MRIIFAVSLLLSATLSFAAEPAANKKANIAANAKGDERGVAMKVKERDPRQRLALVIGNGSYSSAPLKNPANDARLMAATLRRLGFEVDEKTNLDYVQMNKAVEVFGKKLRPGGVGLFYYAGHGIQVGGANYLLPVDADIQDENEVRYKSVDAGLVLAKMEAAKSDVNLVVLDACRNNPFSRSFRSVSRGLASMDAPSGSFIAYATAPGKTAADGSGSNGLYTEELVKQMETRGLSIEEAFKQVRKAVMVRTANAQVPWDSSSLTGDFRFVPLDSMADLQTSSVQPAPSASEPVAQPRALDFIDPTSNMEFVAVPGGCFKMGCGSWAGECYDWEKPVHETCVSNFTIGKYEVTQGQWRQIMGNNPSHFSSCGDNCPVESVSWNDVNEFISKLNSQSGRSYRLPTEAEWEYACRSGGKDEEYCGGNNIRSVAWYDGNSGRKTLPVGQKRANSLGIYDMSGNVWEWVADWYDSYGSSWQQNPSGPSSGSYRVNRGGSWNYVSRGVRASGRNLNDPGYRGDDLGFRLVSPVQ